MFYFIEGISGAGKSTYLELIWRDVDKIIEGDLIKPQPFCDGKRISLDDYKEQHIRQLRLLSDIKSQNVAIMGGLLHTIEYDLIGIYDFGKQQIIQYIEEIILFVPENSRIIYLETTDIANNFKTVLEERYLSRPDWIRGLFDYLNRTAYCQTMGGKGEDGALKLMEMIYECDKDILSKIHIDKKIITRKI